MDIQWAAFTTMLKLMLILKLMLNLKEHMVSFLTNSQKLFFQEVKQLCQKHPNQLKISQFGNLKVRCLTETVIQWVDITIMLKLTLTSTLILKLKIKLKQELK